MRGSAGAEETGVRRCCYPQAQLRLGWGPAGVESAQLMPHVHADCQGLPAAPHWPLYCSLSSGSVWLGPRYLHAVSTVSYRKKKVGGLWGGDRAPVNAPVGGRAAGTSWRLCANTSCPAVQLLCDPGQSGALSGLGGFCDEAA